MDSALRMQLRRNARADRLRARHLRIAGSRTPPCVLNNPPRVMLALPPPPQVRRAKVKKPTLRQRLREGFTNPPGSERRAKLARERWLNVQ